MILTHLASGEKRDHHPAELDERGLVFKQKNLENTPVKTEMGTGKQRQISTHLQGKPEEVSSFGEVGYIERGI